MDRGVNTGDVVVTLFCLMMAVFAGIGANAFVVDRVEAAMNPNADQRAELVNFMVCLLLFFLRE